MKTLNVNITNKVAVYSQRGGEIVCGNDDYQIKFTFDAEWDAYSSKTARFSWNGQYKDVTFTGDTATVPALFNTSVLMVGVYAGDLSTTTRARIVCVPSVLCGTDTAAPESGETYYNEAKAAAERAEAAAETAAAEAAVLTAEKTTEELTKSFKDGLVQKVATRNILNVTWENADLNGSGELVNATNTLFASTPEYVPVTGSETYTLSWAKNDKSVYIYLFEYRADYSLITDTNVGNTTYKANGARTVGAECAFIRIKLWNSGAAPDSFEDNIPENFQMEQGTTATAYVRPLYIDPEEIDAEGLAERMRVRDYADNLPFAEQLPASAWEEGGITDSHGTNITSNYRLRTKGYIQLRAGDTVASPSNNFSVYEYDPKTSAFFGQYESDWVRSYTVRNDCFVRICGYWDETTAIETWVNRMTINRNTALQLQFAALPLDDLREFSEEIVKNKINEKEAESPLPTYYTENNYLKNKVDTIRDYISTANGNYDVFIFCTDMHWTLNAKNSPSIINYLSGKVHINRLFTGGDLADGINMDVIKALNSCFKGSLYNVSGNHEYFDRFEEEGEINYSKTITGGDVWQYLDGQMTDAIVGNAACNYYYVDNITQKMRYIILASFTADLAFELGAEQEAWLRDTALNMPEGYTAIIFTHSMGTERIEDNSLTIHGAGTTVANICDASEANIACIIAGHTHVDIMTRTSGGIPIFVTTCDKYGPWIDNGVDMEPWLSNRVEGTLTEQAFDVFVIDKTNRQINAVRIGCPAIDGATTGLEVRTQTF